MLFLYWPNTILPYKMAAVEQETYGNELASYVVYTVVSETLLASAACDSQAAQITVEESE